MKALITGAGGFVGNHLIDLLCQDESTELIGTTYFPPDQYPHLHDKRLQLRQVDLTDVDAVRDLLQAEKPDHIYHLAAQSYVPASFDDPWHTISNNMRSQLNILVGVHQLDLDARTLVVGTAEIYGPVSPDDIPIDENQPIRPPSPYSVSKVGQDMLGLQYYLSHNVATIRVRPFNQVGPGQNKRFVAPAFASQIAEIEAGTKEPVVHVGNLDARRDFTDVRDMVRAYKLIIKLGEPGTVVNIGSGQARSIQELLDILLSFSETPIEVRVSPDRYRPVDIPIVVCDNTKMKAITGWEPRIAFEDTLRDVMEDWRQRTQR